MRRPLPACAPTSTSTTTPIWSTLPTNWPASLADARALIVRNRTQVGPDLLAAAPRLEVVGRLGVGLDNIDVDACRERNIEVRTAGAANANAVAEYVIGAAFGLVRGAAAALRTGWRRGSGPARTWWEPSSPTAGMGLIGLGGIARLVAIKAAALGMEVTAHDPILSPHDPAWQLATSCRAVHAAAGGRHHQLARAAARVHSPPHRERGHRAP